MKQKIRPIKRIAISDDIVEQIMALIANGDLKPGQRLPTERELCKTFGAGRSSLREALRCLAIMGVLNARVGEGTSVAPDGAKFLERIVEWRLITQKPDIQNLLEVRLALEALAAEGVALHRTDSEFEKLQAIVKKMASAVGDSKKFAKLDLDFHVTMGETSGNPLLFDLISLIRNQLGRVLSNVLLTLPQAMPSTLKEHNAILYAIKRRDAEGARRAMVAHLRATLDRYHGAIGKE